jgi:competence protein ComEA
LFKMLSTLKHSPIPQLTRGQQKGLFLLSLLIFVFLGFQYWKSGQKPDQWVHNLRPEKGITIELKGNVKRPGLLSYSHPPTVQQVIQDAGGLKQSRGLAVTASNLILENDLSLAIFQKDDGDVFLQQGPLSGKALWILGRPIPLNRATAEDLGGLPGVGPTLAGRIIEYREARGGFSSLDELKEVKGIKEKTFEKIKGHFTL